MVEEATYNPKNRMKRVISPNAVEKMIWARVTGGTIARATEGPLILGLVAGRPRSRSAVEALEPQREVLVVHAETDTSRGQRGGRTVEEHVAMAQHDDPVEDVSDGAELVGHEENCGLVLANEVDEGVAEPALRVEVDPRHRLVEDQQLGLACEGLGDVCPLLLTARQLADAPVSEVE
jgi:hypothetical protein